jgi:alcohol dehydrogenase class IV
VRFEFATSARIVFGTGSSRQVASEAAALGRKALLVTDSEAGRTNWLASDLASAGLAPLRLAVPGEPTIALIREGAAQARAAECDVVVACGGGSVMDAGKALAAMLTSPGDVLDYLEVIGRGRALPRPAAPCIAVPTTAGTGSEVTRNAVLASPEHKVKASLRSAGMLPRLAVVDPELTLELPPDLTASTGLDALTQLIEPYVSCRANAFTDLFCADGIPRAARALPRAYRNGEDLDARTEMAMASLLGGLALANAGLGAVHGFAAPIGGMFDAPHGAVCAALLPHVVEANLRALRLRAPLHPALERYEQVARWLTGDESARAEDGAAWLGSLAGDLGIPPLCSYGIRPDDIPELVEKSARASSMKGNPIELTPAEMSDTLLCAL